MAGQQALDAVPAYDEDVIVNLIEQIYKVMILLCYLHASEIIFPPPGGHPVDEALCVDELRLDPRVVSLMRRLPYFRRPRRDGKPIFAVEAEPHALSFLRAEHVRASREPWDLWVEDPRDRSGARLRPTELALVAGSSRDYSMVLDVGDNAIRTVWEPMDYPAARALPAPQVLGDYLRDLRALRYLPDRSGPHIVDLRGPAADEDLEGPARVRRTLLDDYGWGGDDFRAEDWERDCESVWLESKGREDEYNSSADEDTDELDADQQRIRAGQPPLHPEL